METGQSSLTLNERVRATLALGESHFREFKSALEGAPGSKIPRDPKLVRRDVGEALVAFANADGGELLVGVEDDGTVTGIDHDEETIETFMQAWKTHVHSDTPLPQPRVAKIEIGQYLVLYFSVEKGTEYIHLTQDGRCLQRRDRESLPIPSEQIRFERQERISREYDRTFVDDGDPSALDLEVIERISDQIAPGMSPEKVLQLLDLAEFSGERVRLRRAAVLLLARDVSRWHPRCEVRILRVSGSELKTGREYNVTTDTHVRGCVLELLTNAWEDVRPYLIETRLGPEGRFEEQVRYPEDACREALTNAIAHRDYSIEGRAIEVYVFDDRLEVRSPGALLSTVTIDGLRALEGVHQSRNTAIARTLRELGYMREMGEGFRRIFHLMRAHDLVEPEIRADDQSFTVSLQHRSVFSEEDQRWIAAYEVFELEREEEKVLLLGRAGHPLSVQEIMDALDLVDTEDYRVLILGLQQKGLIRGIPKTKSGSATRKAPRWNVIQPRDANRYYGELIRGAQVRFDGSALGARDFTSIGQSLSTDTPYIRQQGLRATFLRLGLIDNVGKPTGRLKAVLDNPPPHDVPLRKAAPKQRRHVEPAPPTSGLDEHVRPSVDEDESARSADDDISRVSPAERSTIFVGNLPFTTSMAELEEIFGAIGEVETVIVPEDINRPARNRGYAFVQLKDPENAKKARKTLEGTQLDGRPMRLEWARS